VRFLTIAEARAEFEEAIDELESEFYMGLALEDCVDESDSDVKLYVRDDGRLVSGNQEDMYFQVWMGDRGWQHASEDYEYWLEGKCDGEAAFRTTDYGWRDE
jgi:hypothetical protein